MLILEGIFGSQHQQIHGSLLKYSGDITFDRKGSAEARHSIIELDIMCSRAGHCVDNPITQLGHTLTIFCWLERGQGMYTMRSSFPVAKRDLQCLERQ